MSAYARLLMSSEVQPKCTHSSCAAPAPRASSSRADPVLHGLDVVIGARLDGLDRRHVGRRRIGGERLEPARARAAAARASTGAAGPCASASNQAHSTRTRSRIRPASLNNAANRRELGGIAAVQRRESVYGVGGGNRLGQGCRR